MRLRLVGAALALLTWAALMPGPAAAGCSHHELARLEGPDYLDSLRASGILGPDADLAVDAEPPAPSPPGKPPGGCTGAACSGKSGLPPAPSPDLAPRPSQWAVIELPPPPIPPAGTPVAREGRCDWSPPSTPAVFHPPRPAAPARCG